MRNLDVCRKIYSRARLSERNDALVSWVALRGTPVLDFTFGTANISRDPAYAWDEQSSWEHVSYSSENFDWMVDHLDFIYSNDHEAAYGILLLLGIMGVCCSPTKRHLFIERLISCMGSNMPTYLRHAALRAAHGAREEIASIYVIDDARLRDMVLTKLSPLSCPYFVHTEVQHSPMMILIPFSIMATTCAISNLSLPSQRIRTGTPICLGIAI